MLCMVSTVERIRTNIYKTERACYNGGEWAVTAFSARRPSLFKVDSGIVFYRGAALLRPYRKWITAGCWWATRLFQLQVGVAPDCKSGPFAGLKRDPHVIPIDRQNIKHIPGF